MLFLVTPTGRLVDLFRKLHNMSRPDEVARVSADFEVEFLPMVRAADQADKSLSAISMTHLFLRII